MSDEKKEKEDDTQVVMETPGIVLDLPAQMPSLPKSLRLEEKKYLLAVERGDLANVRRILQRAHRKNTVNVNCTDPLGRGAVSISIDGENLEMLELLIVMDVDAKDALLHAIDVEFVEAVELLLEYEELTHKDGEPYSWERVDWVTGTYPPDMTPIILAAHRNNYEILKLLLDRGATLPMPHDVRCPCEVCVKESSEDSLRYSLCRVRQYKALASPSLIALSSNDPILTAFQLSYELRNLAMTEQESRTDYMELRRQVQDFAVNLLQQTRSSAELAIILNHDPESPPYEEGERMHLQRLEVAIHMKQKKFVAHRNVQQLLAALWYDGLPGFRRMSAVFKILEVVKIALLFPFYCMLYMVAPDSSTGRLMRKPFFKFLINASSYLFFLLLLILVSQHAEQYLIIFFGTDDMKKALEQANLKQRGNAPTFLEWVLLIYLLGFIWQEIFEMTTGGLQEYLFDMWNVIDFIKNSLYLFVFIFRAYAYAQQSSEISKDPASAYIPREEWSDFDPQLISEGLFAAANIFSALKLVHLFSINQHLGPLQISLGRMVIDIIKFFFIYSLVLFAFACGLNQLLVYFANLERKKCYVLPGDLPDWENQPDACSKWRRFGNRSEQASLTVRTLFEASQSLFWASFGMVGIDSFDLTGIKTYTRFWGQLMFGSYSVINIIVLLNLLIAMMSNSFSAIVEHSDTEWKFARTRLWMNYFEESSTLPPPFNIFPNYKRIMRLLGMREEDANKVSKKKLAKKEEERHLRYTAVIRCLVWRYMKEQQKQADENPVTEDDVNEIKGDISSAKYDILEVLARNGMDTSTANSKDKAVVGKKGRVWQRRLMKDFHLTPESEEDVLQPGEGVAEDPLDRFRRVARLAVLRSSNYKWTETIDAACEVSKIGRSTKRSSIRNQENLQRAMKEAKKLMMHSPVREQNAEYSPVATPELVGASLKELINGFKQETKAFGSSKSSKSAADKGLYLTVSNIRTNPGSQSTNEAKTASIKKRAPVPQETGGNPSIKIAPPTPLPPRGPVIPHVPASPESYHGSFASTEQLIDSPPEGSPRHRIPRKKGGWM